MRIARLILTLTIVFSILMADEAGAVTSIATQDIVVEVSGNVPGFTQEQLTNYLTRKMQVDIPTFWHFVEGKPGNERAANRVVWSFKTLKEVWKGGTHSGFPSPDYSVTYLRAEVKLYLSGVYQMTLDAHPSVGGGAEDEALSEMVHYISHALFIESKPDVR